MEPNIEATIAAAARLRRFFTALPQRASKLHMLLACPAYRRALVHRVAASVEHERTPLGHDYQTVLDVGANRGQFALVAAQRFPRAALVCCEPQDGPRASIVRVLAQHPRLRIVDVALAASAGSRVLHVTRADDSSSLLPTTALQVATFPGTEMVAEVTVATQRLDAVLHRDELVRPVLLKIDVQGTELDVLAGAVGLLDSVDTILIECSFVELYAGQAHADDIISMLHGQGFRLSHLMAPTTDADGRVLQVDLVLERGGPFCNGAAQWT